MTRVSKWIASLWSVAWVFAPICAAATASAGLLTFEDAVRQSDRIAVGTVLRAGVDSVTLPGGGELALGTKDPSTGLVFTPYRVRIAMCLLDIDTSCELGDSEVLIPGGTIYETVEGERRLRTWELATASGVPPLPVGGEVLLFLKKLNGRHFPLNEAGAWVRIDRSSTVASVVLRFATPRFLSDAGRDAARARAGETNPATTAPVFTESVPLDRLKDVISLARQVLKPTSGTRHAISDRADPGADVTAFERGVRVRSGDDARRSDPPLELGGHLDSVHRSHDGRRACGP